MHLLDAEGVRHQQGMVLILHHDERIASHDLVSDIPRRRGSARAPADFKTGTLAEGVQRETGMFAENSPIGGLDGSGLGAQMLAQELLERALANETDAGAIRLVEYR